MKPSLPAVAALALLAAGCLDAPLAVDGPGTGGARDALLEGLDLKARVAEVEGGLRLDATLANDGPRTYQVTAACGSPWGTRMVDDRGRTLAFTEPQATCAAFGLAPLPPGRTLRFNQTWDGRLWDGEDGFDASPGLYTWHVRFTAYTGSGVERPGDARTLDTGVQVRVG